MCRTLEDIRNDISSLSEELRVMRKTEVDSHHWLHDANVKLITFERTEK